MENFDLNQLHQMMLSATENGQPRRKERGTAYGRRVAAEGIDKDRCVEHHEFFRRQFQRENLPLSLGMSLGISLAEASTTPSAPLSSLKVITLPELIIGKRHHGRVLYGRFCVTPFKISSVNSVLEDSAGRGVRVAIYNVLSSTSSSVEIEARFPLGMKVAIKEPFFKLCVDGKPAVRVDNPADVLLDIRNQDMDDCSAADLNEGLETIRLEGNRLFGAQNWLGAVEKYTQVIDQAVRNMEKNGTKMTNTKSETFNRVLMLAYSNRAEVWLRSEAYKDALTDADKALGIDSKHVKSLLRKGKAAYGLGLFEMSCEALKAALEQSPKEHSILENLKASTTAYDQSRNGHFDLTDFYSTGNVPPCADFVGPVEIRRVHYGCGRRGLFATKSVEAGTVLLLSNALASTYLKSDFSKVSLNIQFKTTSKSKGNISSGVQQDLLAALANRVMTSKRQIAQLYSLAVDGAEEMEIPSMELFRPGSEWVPPGADTLAVDIGLIRDIARLNSFGNNDDNMIQIKKRLEDGVSAAKDVHSGLWVLPSFVNHSCAPNCANIFVGNAVFIRASREILEGEELTLSYFEELFENREARQAKAEGWHFACKCERCLLEESFKPQLSKISKRIHLLAAEAKSEPSQEGQKLRATQRLARLADDIEVMIDSQNINLGPKQRGWIRAAFLDAYVSKYKMANDERDAQSTIAALRVIVDSMASVSPRPVTMRWAAVLLKAVELRYFKHSQAYHLTEELVLGIYRAIFGKQPNKILHKLADLFIGEV